MKSIYLKRHELLKEISLMTNRSIDYCILSTSNLTDELARRCLTECTRIIKDDGLFFVHGLPYALPSLLQPLMDTLTFKYWIAVESTVLNEGNGLPTAHAAIVLFSKQKRYFQIAKVRFPHRYCAFCNKTLKDWGGKAHLMHPDGFAISDVWRHFPKTDNYTKISLPVLQTLFSLANTDDKSTGIVGPLESISFEQPDYGDGIGKIKLMNPHVAEELFDKFYSQCTLSAEVPAEDKKRKKPSEENKVNLISEDLVDKVYHGDIVKVSKPKDVFNYEENFS